MISHLSNAGVSVPGGFATTAAAYREFLEQSGLNAKIQAELEQLNVDDVNALAVTGAKIRQWIVETPLTKELEKKCVKHSQHFQTATQISRLLFVLLQQQKIFLMHLLQANKKLS
jgi:phosphoenolpyruvate synthase/pyruvate phosphate dikinase